MFHGMLKRMCILLFGECYRCQLYPVDWWWCCIENYVLTDALPVWMLDVFCVWIFLLIVIYIRFADITICSLFLVSEYMNKTHYIHSTVVGILGFQFLAPVKASKNTHTCLCGYMQPFFLGIYLGMELSCH